MKLAVFLAIILFAQVGFAQKLPYYASIRADTANVRTGPSVKYPIQWVYLQPGWPVKVAATFERWRKITDIKGEAGWIHESLISSSRYVLVETNGVQELLRLPMKSSNVVAIAEDGVVAKLLSCKSGWCKVDAGEKEGWIRAKHLWGVDDGEVVD